jgi:hypothetical protein
MQAESTPQRKYALTKIAAGDYLLPSNDAQMVWRIAKYEDGPTHGLDALPRDRDFWGVWRWRGQRGQSVLDPDDWNQWAMEAASCDTRAEAIRLALGMRTRGDV